MATAAKPKGTTKRASSPKSKKGKTVRRKYVNRLGVDAGLIGTGAKIATDSTPTAGSPLTWILDQSQTVPNRIKYATNALIANASKLDTYVPAVGGAIISAAPKLPVIKHIAKPVDNAIKAFTRGKWGM